MNKCVFICHCLLDPLTRAEGTKKISGNIIQLLLDENISIIQLPCPEMIYGFHRAPCSKEDYDTREFRTHCRKIASSVAETIKKYKQAGCEVAGLISIGGSPSCGAQRTHVQGRHVSEPGIFIEELHATLRAQGLQITVTDYQLLESDSLKQFLSPH